jgi:hypothetical protein
VRTHTDKVNTMRIAAGSWPVSSVVLALTGTALAAVGLFFMFLGAHQQTFCPARYCDDWCPAPALM